MTLGSLMRRRVVYDLGFAYEKEGLIYTCSPASTHS